MNNVEIVGLQNGQAVTPSMDFTKALPTGKRAILYLFEKTELPMQYRRSWMYNFNGEFMNELASETQKIGTLGGGGWSRADRLMYGQPHATSAVLPSANAVAINTHALSEQWSFVLMVRGETGVSPYVVSPTTDTSEIYSGFAYEEPYMATPLALNSASLPTSYNPNCMLQIMHYTKFVADCSIGQQGYNTGSNNLVKDVDIVDVGSAQRVSPVDKDLHDLRPSNLVKNTKLYRGLDQTIQRYRSDSMFPPAAQAGDSSLYIPSRYNDPRQHLGQIVGSIADGITCSAPPKAVLDDDENYIPGEEDSFTPADSMLNTFELSIGSDFNPGRESSLPLGSLVSLSDLDRKFPSMDVMVIRQPHSLQYAARDAGSPNRTNTLASIITSALPGLLVDCELYSIIFDYYSYKTDNTGELGLWMLENYATMYTADDLTVKHRINQFIWLFRHHIVPIVRENGGEFYLRCQTCLGGTTRMDFILCDYPSEATRGWFSVDNRLGGLSSPMLGEKPIAESNASQLCSVIANEAAADSMAGVPDNPANSYNFSI